MTSVEKTMNGAQLKVALGGLGLPPSWFAKRMEVAMRTVVRWFDGDDVDPRVSAEVEKLSALTLAEMQKVVNGVDDSDDPVVLYTYRTDKEFDGEWPAEWHRQMIFRLVEHFESEGRAVSVQYR